MIQLDEISQKAEGIRMQFNGQDVLVQVGMPIPIREHLTPSRDNCLGRIGTVTSVIDSLSLKCLTCHNTGVHPDTSVPLTQNK